MLFRCCIEFLSLLISSLENPLPQFFVSNGGMPAISASLGCVAVSSEGGVWLVFTQSPFSLAGDDDDGGITEPEGIMCSLLLLVANVGGDALLGDLVLAIEVLFVLLGRVVFDKIVLLSSCTDCLQEKMNKEIIQTSMKPRSMKSFTQVQNCRSTLTVAANYYNYSQHCMGIKSTVHMIWY